MRKIQIGGVIKEAIISQLIREINKDGAFASPDDASPVMLAGVNLNAIIPIIEDGKATVYHPQALQFTEEFCVQKQISFDLIEIAAIGSPSRGRFFRVATKLKPAEDKILDCDINGNPVMDYSKITSLIEDVKKLSKQSIVTGRLLTETLDKHVTEFVYALPKLTVRG